MASVIIVVIIFVLLALAILFICQNGGWQGGCGGKCRLPQQMRRSGKEAEEITLTSLCEGGGQEFRSPFARGAFFLPCCCTNAQKRVYL